MSDSTEANMATSTLPTSTETAAHYVWGDGCDGWHLVRDASLSVIEERMPAGTSEVRHWHARSRQFFYVLSGTLTMEVEGVRHRLPARSGIELPPGTAHQALNDGAVDAEFLVVSMPPSHGDRHQEGTGGAEATTSADVR
jgi:mannose-6-phosphate isomerase-like protein (cupin superfamily)